MGCFWRSAVTEEIRRTHNNRDNCKLCLTVEEVKVSTFEDHAVFLTIDALPPSATTKCWFERLNKPVCKVWIVYGPLVGIGNEMLLNAMNMCRYLMWFLKGTFWSLKLAQAFFHSSSSINILLCESTSTFGFAVTTTLQSTSDLDSCSVLQASTAPLFITCFFCRREAVAL